MKTRDVLAEQVIVELALEVSQPTQQHGQLTADAAVNEAFRRSRLSWPVKRCLRRKVTLQVQRRIAAGDFPESRPPEYQPGEELIPRLPLPFRGK